MPKEEIIEEETPIQQDNIIVIPKRYFDPQEDNIQPKQKLSYEERHKKEVMRMESLVEQAWNKQQKGEKVGDFLLAIMNDFLKVMGENYFINKQSKEIEASPF